MDNELLIFVYGTLKKENGNNWYLQNAKFLGKGHTKGNLYKCGLPYLTDGKDNIEGEVYIVSYDDYLPIRYLEIGAGYYEDIIEVKCKGKKFDCIAFKYSKAEVESYGYAKRITKY